MNPSTSTPHQPSTQGQDELHSNDQGSSVTQWTMDAEGDSATKTLPNEVLLMIFHYLPLKRLLEFPLKRLLIYNYRSSKEFFLPISQLTLLRNLTLDSCRTVDSDVLIEIIHGCPNLKDVCLDVLPLVGHRGLKALTQCKHLTHLNISNVDMMSDEVLIEIAKVGLLKRLVIAQCEITDRGVSAILAQCPRLEYLDVAECEYVEDSTVDAAIAAVESRASKPIATVPGGEAVQKSRCLLRLRISDRYLNRNGFSHPLLELDLWYPLENEWY